MQQPLLPKRKLAGKSLIENLWHSRC